MKKLLAFMVAFVAIFCAIKSARATQPIYSLNHLPPEAATQDKVYLGKTTDPKTGREVEGYAYITRKNSSAPNSIQSQTTNQTNQATSSAQSQTVPQTGCYGFIGSLDKIKQAKPWVMNPTNNAGLDENTVYNIYSANINKWQDAADGKVDGNLKTITGPVTITHNPLTGGYNGQNEVFFGPINDPNLPNSVAVTVVYSYGSSFSPNMREIVEWDSQIDDRYSWSTTGEPGKLDFENVTVHEIGEIFGMAVQPNSACSNQAMYQYSAPEDISHRNLGTQDITGIWQLYVDHTVDTDHDGFPDYAEQYMNTDPFNACGPNAFPADANGSTNVNSTDLLMFAKHFGNFGATNYDPRFDTNANGSINSTDLLQVANKFGPCRIP